MSGARRQITRTTGTESNPRWARNDTHVTYVRDGNLFIVPVDGSTSSIVTQLTDVAPKKTEPRLTESQTFIRAEEEKLIDFIRQRKEDKKKEWYVKRTEDFSDSPKAWHELAILEFEVLFPDSESALPYNENLSGQQRLEIADKVMRGATCPLLLYRRPRR